MYVGGLATSLNRQSFYNMEMTQEHLHFALSGKASSTIMVKYGFISTIIVKSELIPHVS